jgi:polyisoprenoid-binding protein YceI
MTTATTARTSTWKLDPAHATAEFAVKHLVVATVKGRFRNVEATLEIDEDHPENSSVTASIEVASIDTNMPDRDADLRSENFFDAASYPTIEFRSTGVEKASDNRYRVYGDLTIRDVTKPVSLETEFEGEVTDGYGNRRAAFAATTGISRKEFGIRWNQLLETGGAVVGDNVKISLYLEAVEQR